MYNGSIMKLKKTLLKNGLKQNHRNNGNKSAEIPVKTMETKNKTCKEIGFNNISLISDDFCSFQLFLYVVTLFWV